MSKKKPVAVIRPNTALGRTRDPTSSATGRSQAEAEAMVASVRILAELASTGIREAEAWSALQRDIEKLDADTANVVRRLAADMELEREKTERFRMLLDTAAKLPQHDLTSAILAMVQKIG